MIANMLKAVKPPVGGFTAFVNCVKESDSSNTIYQNSKTESEEPSDCVKTRQVLPK
jgi:hypothetical protein